MGNDSVRIVVSDVDKPNSFLLVCEADDNGNWKLPGGKLELGENPTQAAVRELSEELNLKLTLDQLGDAFELVNDDGKSKRYIFRHLTAVNNVIPSDEIAQVMWTDIQDVPDCKNKNHISLALRAVGL